jgi:enoyl-CoA hydratase/carnithine racemase
VVANPTARFGLPEVQVGLYAYGGGLPRLMRTAGLHIASEIALSGRPITANQALQWNLVNRISSSSETLMDEAFKMARDIAAISPDAILVTKTALREAWKVSSVEIAFRKIHGEFYEALMAGQNSREGLAAFREKRSPKWVASRL